MDPEHSCPCPFLAEVMIAYARLDVTPLIELLARFGEVPRQGPIWIAFGKLATGWLCMLRQDYDGALLAATEVAAGADAALIPRLITGFATGLQAMALVHRGEAARALTILDGVESLGDHALCFDLQRATAYLQLGENRQALVGTDGCLRLGVAHTCAPCRRSCFVVRSPITAWDMSKRRTTPSPKPSGSWQRPAR